VEKCNLFVAVRIGRSFSTVLSAPAKPAALALTLGLYAKFRFLHQASPDFRYTVRRFEASTDEPGKGGGDTVDWPFFCNAGLS
jgi:hypothetical protein